MVVLGSRKTVGLDSELIERLKKAAGRRGVTISKYLKALINEALSAEGLGLYAPKALRQKRIEHILENLNFAYVPKELLEGPTLREAEELGRRLGVVTKEMGVEPAELLELLSGYVSNTIMYPYRIVLIKSPENRELSLVSFIKGVSASVGFRVEDKEGVVVIELPEEPVKSALSEFSERKPRRRGRSSLKEQ